MSAEAAADGARWALLAVFALAAIEKFLSLHSRSAAWHPVMLVSERRRRIATELMAVSLMADILAIALLVVRPVLGAVISGVLLAGYSIAGARAHASGEIGGCRCVWKLLNTSTKSSFIVRNSLLAGLAGGVALVSPASSREGFMWSVFIFTFSVCVTRLTERGNGQRAHALQPIRADDESAEGSTAVKKRKQRTEYPTAGWKGVA